MKGGVAPPFYVLVKLLHREATDVSRQVHLVSEMRLERLQRRAYRQEQAKIFKAWDRYKVLVLKTIIILIKPPKAYIINNQLVFWSRSLYNDWKLKVSFSVSVIETFKLLIIIKTKTVTALDVLPLVDIAANSFLQIQTHLNIILIFQLPRWHPDYKRPIEENVRYLQDTSRWTLRQTRPPTRPTTQQQKNSPFKD